MQFTHYTIYIYISSFYIDRCIYSLSLCVSLFLSIHVIQCDLQPNASWQLFKATSHVPSAVRQCPVTKNLGIGWVLVCAVIGFIIIVVMILIMMNLIMMRLEFFIRSIYHVSSWFMFCQRSSLSYYDHFLFRCLTRPAARKESEFQEMFRSRNFLTTCLFSFYVKFP